MQVKGAWQQPDARREKIKYELEEASDIQQKHCLG
jgi:hypothetical protein